MRINTINGSEVMHFENVLNFDINFICLEWSLITRNMHVRNLAHGDNSAFTIMARKSTST